VRRVTGIRWRKCKQRDDGQAIMYAERQKMIKKENTNDEERKYERLWD
jgi:hypothetical protein